MRIALTRPSRLASWLAPGLVATAVCGLAFQPAWSARPEGGAMSACATDLATFCPGIEAGGGKKMRCLTANQPKLSNACAVSLNERRAARAARRGETQVAQAPSAPGAVAPPPAAAPDAAEPATPADAPARANMRACRTDVATFCATVEPGGGRKIKCLMDNQANVSPECAGMLSALHTQRQEKKEQAREACLDDALKFCANARGPARQQCLATNKAQLSPACAAVVEKRLARQGAQN